MRKKSLLYIFGLFMFGFCSGQEKKYEMKPKYNYNVSSCNGSMIVFSYILPILYQHHEFDSIKNYLDRREKICGKITDIVCLRILLSMQNNSFRKEDLNAGGFYDFLENYSRIMMQMNKNKQVDYMSKRNFNGSVYSWEIFTVTRKWANDILATKQLDSTGKYLCHVFNGSEYNPVREIKSWPANEYLNKLLISSFTIHRNAVNTTCSLETGIWFPFRHLKSLGNHPEIAFRFGARDLKNETGITILGRFVRTPSDYTVLRNGIIYSRHTYIGHLVGLDYSRYLVHALVFEAGPIIGIGYEGFYLAEEEKNQHINDYLKPLAIGTFNFNLGFRANYFFDPELYIGICPKYNFLRYSNAGGTPLNGNALSIEFTVGGNF